MQYLRLLLLPFSVIYGIVTWLRNKAYDAGIFHSKSFDIPVISIGNLAIGGAGKSPMAEYILRLVKGRYKTAVLSRGYGRKTKGFRFVNPEDAAVESGDEPLQFSRKFPGVTVAVSEKRVPGIEKLQENHELIVLDDAFQHRAVKPGLSILIFDYSRIDDFFLVLPAGNLRESFSNRTRADLIIISKCPESLTDSEKKQIIQRIKPLSHQKLFFSWLDYDNLVHLYSEKRRDLQTINFETQVFLLTGIANPFPLLKKVKSLTSRLIHHDYPDHHPFSTKNITKLAQEFAGSSFEDKIIVTTEKDAQRLRQPELVELLKDLPVYYLPVTARIHQPDDARFDKLIESYVKGNIQHNSIH